jgi:sugar phosphate permease
VFYGWLIVAGGMGIQALQAALMGSAFSSYTAVLQSEFGWSRTVFSFAYAAQQVESGILGPVQGTLIDRFGPRTVMRVGIIVFGGGLMLFSRVNSIPTFYLCVVLMAIGTGLSGFFPLSVTLVNWFARRRATALAVMSTGMSIGGLLVPVTAWSMNVNGWRPTVFVSGLIVIAAGLPLVRLMRHRPEEHGYLPDGDQPGGGATEQGAGRASPGMPAVVRTSVDFTPREAMRTSAFWLISLGHGSALLVVGVVSVFLVLFLQQSLGYSITRGAAIVSLVTGSQMVGQLSGGVLGDRFNKRLIVTLCMFGHALALFILAFATALWMVILFAVLHGLSWGMRGPQMQAIRADYFGRASFGTIMGYSSMIITVFIVAGPMFAAVMADRFGNYRIAFTVLAALAGLGSLFWVFARQPMPPSQPE